MIFSKLRESPAENFWYVAAALAGGALVYNLFQNYSKGKGLPTEWEEVGTVSRLNLHPIKSCGGISLTEASATSNGINFGSLLDRSFIVYTEDGDMVTGRQIGKMTTLTTSLNGKQFVISCKGGSESISLDMDKLDQLNDWKKFKLREATVSGTDCGDDVAKWLTKHLQSDGSKKLRLIYKGGVCRWKRPKRKFQNFDFPNFGKNDTPLYQDSSAFLIMSESSLEDLNNRLDTPVHFGFFRPSIVISGSKPFDEDSWTYIKIGNKVVLHEVKPREICLQTKVDPSTGLLRTDHFDMLNSYRQMTYPEVLAKEWKNRAIFGIQCGIDIEGQIKLGDKVYVSRNQKYWTCN